MMIFDQTIDAIASPDNLLSAWEEFLPGKKGKLDVQSFKLQLMENILSLNRLIVNGAYEHGGYHAFNIADPKPRNIHKASVRDRLVHHAMYRVLYPFFDRLFIADSFSCRVGKGTHAALQRFRSAAFEVSKNNTRTCWILKCDIKKFFASIDHAILFDMLQEHIPDQSIRRLLFKIIHSFSSKGNAGIGLPLGNLTSQLFMNIYMNRFDQFVKHDLRVKHYIRYADDFIIFSPNRQYLELILPEISAFLGSQLRLQLHPQKVSIETLASGVDFLGWIHFPDHRVLRTATRRRMLKRVTSNSSEETRQSYLGLLRHGNAKTLTKSLNIIYNYFQ